MYCRVVCCCVYIYCTLDPKTIKFFNLLLKTNTTIACYLAQHDHNIGGRAVSPLARSFLRQKGKVCSSLHQNLPELGLSAAKSTRRTSWHVYPAITCVEIPRAVRYVRYFTQRWFQLRAQCHDPRPVAPNMANQCNALCLAAFSPSHVVAAENTA